MQRKWETIRTESDCGVVTVTLDRPDRMNAMNLVMKRELGDVLAQSVSEFEVKAIVITGSGRAFCSGADLKDMSARTGPAYREELRRLQASLIEALTEAPKPVIAAVNGPAVGGGMSLAIACDVILASEDSYFLASQLPTVGVIPDLGLLHMLPRSIGAARARAMFTLGERLTAERAQSWGLVWNVTPPAVLLERARETALRASRIAPAGIAAAKRLLAGPAQGSLAELLEAEATEVALLRQTKDHREAVAAFAERRPPRFKGE